MRYNVTVKVIFLDVDGVLNGRKTFVGPDDNGRLSLDPGMCDQLKRIVDSCWPNTPIVVLSSTWRLFPASKEAVTRWLSDRGIEIHSQTDDLGHVLRGEEINKWFADRPHITRNFIILDDGSDFTEEQKPFLIQTSFDDGLTPEKADNAIRILKEL